MLVLTRKQQERIQIGDSITITVVRIQGSTVRIGIEAPHEVRVIRGEIAAKVVASERQPAPLLADINLGEAHLAAGVDPLDSPPRGSLGSRPLAAKRRSAVASPVPILSSPAV